MGSMFQYTPSLRTPLDLSNFDTSKVTNMERMFGTHFGDDIDVSSFNTANVTDMGGMFSSVSLASLDLSNFNTINVTDMSSMFNYSIINNINLNSFNTSKVTNMRSMFEVFKTNGTIDLSHFDTSNVTNMSSMFKNGANEINLSSFDTSNVTSMYSMFQYYDRYELGFDLDLSHFNTSKVENFRSIFSGFKGSSLNLSNWDLSANAFTYTPNQWGHPFGSSWTLVNFDGVNKTLYCNHPSGSIFDEPCSPPPFSIDNLSPISPINYPSGSSIQGQSSIIVGNKILIKHIV